MALLFINRSGHAVISHGKSLGSNWLLHQPEPERIGTMETITDEIWQTRLQPEIRRREQADSWV